MIPDNFRQLLDRLIDKTSKKQAIWTKTSREHEFQVALEKATITVDKWTVDGKKYADMAVYNTNGEQISRFATSIEKPDEYQHVLQLHSLAAKEYFKVDETFKDILKELDTDKTIGSAESPPSDDLPF